MRLLEYEAKKILSTYSVPIPYGVIIEVNDLQANITVPVILKSQVPTGRRGKAGGVIIVREPSDLQPTIATLSGRTIHGFTPQKLLAEELIDIKREFYFSLIINRETSQIELLANTNGGIEIEEQDSEAFFRHSVDPRSFEALSNILADSLDIPDKAFLLQDIIANTHHCFVSNDCLLLEINPLILTTDETLVAGDAKITLDDAAFFRHPEWHFDETPDVTLDPNGTIATIANGAGLAMATVDAVADAGFIPANFLDIGGNATPQKIMDCFRRISALPHVTAIVINIFGGIVRCDDVAQAILDAKETFPDLPPLHVRLVGNRADKAKQLLADASIPLYNTLADALEALS
ncbi:hypothetical protein HG436_000505 [Candidatus Saccharibacteria bacterium]|nr:hypothetical protein [Candidatus Saccharibacteria bacterium]